MKLSLILILIIGSILTSCSHTTGVAVNNSIAIPRYENTKHENIENAQNVSKNTISEHRTVDFGISSPFNNSRSLFFSVTTSSEDNDLPYYQNLALHKQTSESDLYNRKIHVSAELRYTLLGTTNNYFSNEKNLIPQTFGEDKSVISKFNIFPFKLINEKNMFLNVTPEPSLGFSYLKILAIDICAMPEVTFGSKGIDFFMKGAMQAKLEYKYFVFTYTRSIFLALTNGSYTKPDNNQGFQFGLSIPIL